MNVTRNLRVIALFSGMIGTFLESSQNSIYSGHDIQLLNTYCQWLLMHNLLFTCHDVRSELGMNPVPSAVLFDEEAEDRPLNRPDIILNPEPYDERTQNKEYHYFRLPVASLIDSNKQTTELLCTDPIIEPHSYSQFYILLVMIIGFSQLKRIEFEKKIHYFKVFDKS